MRFYSMIVTEIELAYYTYSRHENRTRVILVRFVNIFVDIFIV